LDLELGVGLAKVSLLKSPSEGAKKGRGKRELLAHVTAWIKDMQDSTMRSQKVFV
jgi:hypothetical protein